MNWDDRLFYLIYEWMRKRRAITPRKLAKIINRNPGVVIYFDKCWEKVDEKEGE